MKCTGLASFSGSPHYICLVCSEAEIGTFHTDESIGLKDGRLEEVEEFCFLGYTLDCDGERRGGAERSVRHRIWWRNVIEEICEICLPEFTMHV